MPQARSTAAVAHHDNRHALSRPLCRTSRVHKPLCPTPGAARGLQVSGSLLDDDTHFTACDQLTLTAPNGTRFKFAGVRQLLRSGTPAEAMLSPPDAVGEQPPRQTACLPACLHCMPPVPPPLPGAGGPR
jgi:hypothetical protein